MPVGGRLWKHPKVSIGVGAVALADVVAVVFELVSPVPEEPLTFGPWYPLVNHSGDPAVADFENHVPCAIDDPPAAECQRVKLGVVLYRSEATGAPSTYLISVLRVGVGNDRERHEGTWTVARGTGLDPQATVYQLDTGAPEHLRQYWPVGDNILYLLDKDKMPRVGDAAYGYALSSIPIGQKVQAPR
jgi:hypothetical protein